MLDVIIAYVVILLVLSTITTAILQLLQRITYLRHWWLVRSLGKILQRVTNQDRASAKNDANKLLAELEANPMGHRRPDFVEGRHVRRWLRQAILDKANEDDLAEHAPWLAEGAEARFDRWWKDAEKQMSSSFRLYVVVFSSVVIGFGLSWATGLEAVSMARHLSESPAEVQALLDDADRSAGGSHRSVDNDAFSRAVEREINDNFSTKEQRERKIDLLVCFDAFASESKAHTEFMHAATIEVGIRRATVKPERCPLDLATAQKELLPSVVTAHDTISGGLGFGGYPLTENLPLRYFGRALMALLIGLGAPFWFEILGLLRLPLGTKPQSTENKKT